MKHGPGLKLASVSWPAPLRAYRGAFGVPGAGRPATLNAGSFSKISIFIKQSIILTQKCSFFVENHAQKSLFLDFESGIVIFGSIMP
jgi:hypothetical protein